MAASEMRGFIFCVVYILVFATLLEAMPVGYLGVGGTPDTAIPINPSLIAGFAESESYCGDNFTGGTYEYSLNSMDWIVSDAGNALEIVKKVYVFGTFWFGGIDECRFTSEAGTSRGTVLAFTEIDADADEGQVRYSLQLLLSGDSAGALVIYWNTTAYDNATHAHNNNELYIIHGFGVDDLATNNIGFLIVSILFFQMPQIPVLVNAFIALPTWACLVYLAWYLITSMIPFVGGS